MARVYATPVQYAAWLAAGETPGDPPAGAARALRAASGRVDDMLLTANYPVDAAGMPTEAGHVTALMEATCAQADYQRAIGDPNGVGTAGQYASVKVGSASMVRGTRAGGGTEKPAPWSAEAWSILQREGLVPEAPWDC